MKTHHDGKMIDRSTYTDLEKKIKDLERELAGLRGTTGVDGRKDIEKALKESEEKYRSIIETMEDGYWEVDLTGNLQL